MSRSLYRLHPFRVEFYSNNCFKNGILPIRLSEEQVDELFKRAEQYPAYELTIDLQSQTVADAHGLSYSFEVDEYRRYCLLNGLDDIGITLQLEEKISAFEAARK